jgi:ankyrin repeat protein
VTWACKKWTNGDVIGLAANVDTGSIAVSINGIWEGEGCGIVFEDDKIKEGVYPCLSLYGSYYGKTRTLRWLLKAEDWKHAPPGAGVWDRVNTTPLTLHDAIGWGKGAAVIDAIIKAAPEAVKETGEGIMQPLHWTALSQNEEAMTTLIRVSPDGASTKEDKNGRLPLHLALLYEKKNAAGYGIRVTCSSAAIAALLQAYPSAAEKADKYGILPLHIACMGNTKVEVVETLLKAFPQAAEKANNYGMLPLHYACAYHPEKEVVVALLLAFPSFECFDYLKDKSPKHLKKFLELELNEALSLRPHALVA